MKYIIFSRTLTWVYDAILDDLVFPAEIVGKRIRVKLDGKQILKVHLDKTQQTNIEHKVNDIHLKVKCSCFWIKFQNIYSKSCEWIKVLFKYL